MSDNIKTKKEPYHEEKFFSLQIRRGCYCGGSGSGGSQNDQVAAKYTNRKTSINGNRIELSYVMANNTDMSQKDTFEVSGSASQMKWALVSSVTTYQGTPNSDTSHSTLLQNMFGLSGSDYPVKKMTFVPN